MKIITIEEHMLDPAVARASAPGRSSGYMLKRHPSPTITLCGMGAVVCSTNPGLLFAAAQGRHGLANAPDAILDSILPADRARPMVTVLDGHPHTLAFLPSSTASPPPISASRRSANPPTSTPSTATTASTPSSAPPSISSTDPFEGPRDPDRSPQD